MGDLKHLLRLDLEALYTFVVVAELRSFSAAAEVLHKTTSTISYRIKALEDSLGVALIERTTRSVSLAPSGERLLEKASQMFEWQRSIPEELKQIRDGIEPSFMLVFNNLLYDSGAAALLLAHLHQLYPFTTFKIRQAVYMGVWDAMQFGGGQMAVGAPGLHSISDDFRTEALGFIDWVPVASADHPLARQDSPITADMMRRYPVINIEDTSLRLQKRPPWRLTGQQEMIVPDMETKIDTHAAGLGIGFLPRSIAQVAIETRGLVELNVARTFRPPSPLALAWRLSGAGRICAYLRLLFEQRDPLMLPFLQHMSASMDDGIADGESWEGMPPADQDFMI